MQQKLNLIIVKKYLLKLKKTGLFNYMKKTH